MSSATLNDWAC